MKIHSPPPSGGSPFEAGPRPCFPAFGPGWSIRAALALLCAGLLSFAPPAAAAGAGGPPKLRSRALPDATCTNVVANPISQFSITVDGRFTDGFDSEGQLAGEWSDVIPQAFMTTPNGVLLRTCLDDPGKTALLWVSLAKGFTSEDELELYLMYESLNTPQRPFFPGETVADIAFPLVVGGVRKDIVVQIRGRQFSTTAPAARGSRAGTITPTDSFFDVFVLIDDQQVPAGQFGLEAAVGFGPSPFAMTPHLQVELEVPLVIPANFGPAFPPAGLPGDGNGNGYSPEPAFWNASGPAGQRPTSPAANGKSRTHAPARTRTAAPVGEGMPLSSALFVILPDGTTMSDSGVVPSAGCTEPLEITCPGDMIVILPPDATGLLFTYPPPSAPACLGVTCVPPSGSLFPLGVTTVTCTATDATGASTSCSFTVTVKVASSLAITCPPDVTVECGGNLLPAKTGKATAKDGCSPVTITWSDTSANGPKPIVKIITRTWTATDSCGNKVTCDQKITVVDNRGPVIHRFTAAPAKLAPANNKFVSVKLLSVVEDSCSTDKQVKKTIAVKVTDPAGSDGKTYFTIKSLTEVSLRAKKGVSYMITLTCTDAFGNKTSKSIVVPVK